LAPDAYWKEEYFSFPEDYFGRQIAQFKSLFHREVVPKALDVGAGLGKCMMALRRAGFDVRGIEASEPFYRAALERTGFSTAELTFISMEEAAFDSGYFDFITLGAVLEHLYDPSASIRKAMGWLRPGGLLYVEVPSSAWLISKLGNIFYRLTGVDYVANLSPMHPPYHLYEFGLPSFQLHARNYGYELARHQFYVAQTFMPKFLDPILRRVMEMTDTGMQLEVWLRKI
jgi:SAM-dependent methyltransferase